MKNVSNNTLIRYLVAAALLFAQPAQAQQYAPDQRYHSGLAAQTNKANTFQQTQTFNKNVYVSAGYVETAIYSNGNSGTSFALNIDNGPLQSITISGAVAITLTTPTHAGKTTVVLTQDGSGHVYSISGCKWTAGSAITYSTAASKVDIISIIYDGANMYCMGGAAFS